VIVAVSGILVRAQGTAPEARIHTLLSQMTLEEKLGQLQQVSGGAEGSYEPQHLELARRGLLGSMLNVRGAARVNAIQKAAVEQSRLKIPGAARLRRDSRLPDRVPDPVWRSRVLGSRRR
jgi:beta-glucosidase